jgi:hypothetical protein
MDFEQQVVREPSVGLPNRPLALLLVLVLGVGHVSASDLTPPRQTASERGWARVRKLPVDSEIVITLKGSAAQTRRFLYADEDVIRLAKSSDSTADSITRDGVLEISNARRATHIGAIVGGAIMLLSGPVNKGSPSYLIVTGSLWAGFGALVGSNFTVHRVIYRAQ